jgi:hypothetical protein
MNVPKGIRDDVSVIVRDHMVPTKTKNPGTRARRMRVKYGDDLAHDLLLHRTCDLSGKGVKVALNHIEHIAKLEQCRAEAQAAGVPASVKDLEIDGHDAQYYAGCSGRSIGEVLGLVLDEVVCDPAGTKLTRQWQIYRMIAHARRLGMMPRPTMTSSAEAFAQAELVKLRERYAADEATEEELEDETRFWLKVESCPYCGPGLCNAHYSFMYSYGMQ